MCTWQSWYIYRLLNLHVSICLHRSVTLRTVRHESFLWWIVKVWGWSLVDFNPTLLDCLQVWMCKSRKLKRKWKSWWQSITFGDHWSWICTNINLILSGCKVWNSQKGRKLPLDVLASTYIHHNVLERYVISNGARGVPMAQPSSVDQMLDGQIKVPTQSRLSFECF